MMGQRFACCVGLTFVLSGSTVSACNEVPLRIAVTAQKDVIAQLEALPLVVSIENSGAVAIRLNLNMFTCHENGSVVVKHRRGDARVIRTPARGGATGYAGYRWLQPGESFTTSLAVSCDFPHNEGSVFTATGRYDLLVRYDDGEVAAESKPIRVSVVRPPKSESKAFKLVKALRYPDVLYEPDLMPPEKEQVTAALEEIASIEESVIYANYARLSLAWRHLMAAQMAGGWPDLYDLDKELAEAARLLAAIKNEEFTLIKKVEELRKQLKDLKAAVESAKE